MEEQTNFLSFLNASVSDPRQLGNKGLALLKEIKASLAVALMKGKLLEQIVLNNMSAAGCTVDLDANSDDGSGAGRAVLNKASKTPLIAMRSSTSDLDSREQLLQQAEAGGMPRECGSEEPALSSPAAKSLSGEDLTFPTPSSLPESSDKPLPPCTQITQCNRKNPSVKQDFSCAAHFGVSYFELPPSSLDVKKYFTACGSKVNYVRENFKKGKLTSMTVHFKSAKELEEAIVKKKYVLNGTKFSLQRQGKCPQPARSNSRDQVGLKNKHMSGSHNNQNQLQTASKDSEANISAQFCIECE